MTRSTSHIESRHVGRSRAVPIPGFLSSQDLCDLTGASYRQIDYWDRQGLLRTSSDGDRPGSGGTRYFPESEVDVARMLLRLSALRDTQRTTNEALLAAGEKVRDGATAVEVVPGVWVVGESRVEDRDLDPETAAYFTDDAL